MANVGGGAPLESYVVALCRYVRTYVHYKEQIEFLYKNSTSFELLRVLEKCCDEEVEHQTDTKLHKGNNNNSFERFWSNLIGSRSSFAVNFSKQY